MSQAKVDRYKEQKKNRAKIMAKEKRERLLWKVGGCAVVLLFIGWIGFSAYGKYYVAPAHTYEVTPTAVADYLSGLNAEEAE